MSLKQFAIAFDQGINALIGGMADTVYAYSVKYNFHC